MSYLEDDFIYDSDDDLIDGVPQDVVVESNAMALADFVLDITGLSEEMDEPNFAEVRLAIISALSAFHEQEINVALSVLFFISDVIEDTRPDFV